jgi:hypothetical protein
MALKWGWGLASVLGSAYVVKIATEFGHPYSCLHTIFVLCLHLPIQIMSDLESAADTIAPCPDGKETRVYGGSPLPSGTSIETKIQERPSVETLILIDQLELRLLEDGYLKWKPDASSHPRNWNVGRKSFDTILVLLLDLFT